MDYHDWPSPEDCPHSKCSRRKFCIQSGRPCSGRLYELKIVKRLSCEVCPIRGDCQAGKYLDYDTWRWERRKTEPLRCDRWMEEDEHKTSEHVCIAVSRYAHTDWKRADKNEIYPSIPLFGTGTAPGENPDARTYTAATKSHAALTDPNDRGRCHPRAMDTSENVLARPGVCSYQRLPELIMSELNGLPVSDVNDPRIVDKPEWYSWRWREAGWIGREWYEVDANGRPSSKDARAERMRKIVGWPRRGRLYLKPVSKGRGIRNTWTSGACIIDGKLKKLSGWSRNREARVFGMFSLLLLPRRNKQAVLWQLLHTTRTQREIAEDGNRGIATRAQIRALAKKVITDIEDIAPPKIRVPVANHADGLIIAKCPIMRAFLPPLDAFEMKINKRKSNAQIARRYKVSREAVGKMIEKYEKMALFGMPLVDTIIL